MTIAVTGGTGFVGAALLSLLASGDRPVRALARDPSRIEPSERISIVEGDLENAAALAALCEGASAVIHLAGVTHPRSDEDFVRVNVEGAARVAAAARDAGAKFVHASSLSARKPDTSPYAASKFQSETSVQQIAETGACVILRLPAIYGPGDRATLPFFRLVKSGLALAPRTKPPARASLLYVDDAARALIAAANCDAAVDLFEIGDETANGRTWREIGDALGNIMNKNVNSVAVPRPLVAMFHNISRMREQLFGLQPSVRTGQVNEFFHPDWAVRDRRFEAATGWRPEVPLSEGFAKTVRWYQENALL